VFVVHRMVAEGTRSNQKLLALREKGVILSSVPIQDGEQ
jgi:hypothetical protein